jgi:hypothetical protein
MSVSRKGFHTKGHKGSHISGKRQSKFASRIKDNLERQVDRLNKELTSGGKVNASKEE